MAEANNTPGCSDAHCQLYSILNTPTRRAGHKVISDLPELNKSQFCEAFFHVPKVLDWNTIMQCLDEDKCRVYTLENENPQSQPKYVVSFVVLKIGNDVKYKALFENCVRKKPKPTKHAEEFFHEDARTRELKRILDDSDLNSRMANLNLKEKYMYMYITLQPCHKSIKTDPKKSCTEKLIKFYEENLKGPGIHFIVKPTFIYKAYWSETMTEDKIDEKTKKEINNAKEGLRNLFKKGIQVQAMEEEDWTFLKDHLCPSIELFPGSTYEESERKKLDDFIREFLEEIESTASTSDSDSTASDSDPPPRDSAQRSSGSDSTASDSDPPPSDSDPPPSDSDPPPSGSASPPSDSASPPSDSASPPRGSAPQSSANASGARSKGRTNKEDDKKEETEYDHLKRKLKKDE